MRYVLLILLLFTSAAGAASIGVEADRNTVHLNESFQLVFTASGSVDDDPDFSPLETHFDILGRSKSSNISIINGDFQKTTRWSLNLMPRKAGSLTIPAINFGSDTSPQLRITVKAARDREADDASPLSLEMSVDKEQLRVQGQLLVTVKLKSRENIARYGINDLRTDGVETRVEQLGEDKQYRAYQDGQAYLVLERRYALFPEQAGELHIGGVLAEVELGSARGNLFDRFNRGGQVRRLQAPGRDITVRDIPANYSARHWLPAREIQLVEEWPDATDGEPQFRVGEPVTRILSLLADGLTSAQLPPLTPLDVDGIKRYPDQPTLHDNKKPEGIIGIREERIALIPTRPGRYTLPAVEIPWWNTETGTMETARIPAREIQVSPAAGNRTASGIPAPNREAPSPEPEVAPPEATGPASADTSISPSGDRVPAFWRWLSLVLGLGWLLTLVTLGVAQWRRGRRIYKSDGPQKLNRALKSLTAACSAGDARACRAALLDWARIYYDDPGLSNLGELGRRAGEPLQSAIAALESSLYSDRPGDWDGTAMADTCRHMTQQRQPSAGTRHEELEPLYK